MKKFLLVIAVAVGLSSGSSKAAVVVSSANFTDATTGFGLIDDTNNLYSVGTAFWTVGVFSGTVNWNATAASVLSHFTQVATVGGSTTVGVDGLSPFAGVFNGSVEYLSSTGTPGPYPNQPLYVVVGNSAVITGSTRIAVFNTGVNFIAGDALGNGTLSAPVTTAMVTYGNVGSVNTTPGGVFSFSQSVQLVSIPEPSTALLGLLGGAFLLRRRR